MNRITDFLFLILAGLIISSLAGCGRLQGTRVDDGQGRYSYKLSQALETVPGDGSYHHYYLEEKKLHSYFSAETAAGVEEGLSKTFAKAGLDFSLYSLTGATGMGPWNLRIYTNPQTSRTAAVAFQERQNTTYTFLVVSDDPAVDPSTPPAPIMNMISTFALTDKAGKAFSLDSLKEIEDYAALAAEKSHGSISIAVLKNDKIVYRFVTGTRNGQEEATVETAYNWGSISKTMVATAVMTLVEKGKLDLDAKVSGLIPELTNMSDEVRVRNLLTHTSGLPDSPDIEYIIGFGGVQLPSLEAVLAGNLNVLNGTASRPSKSMSYNNWNFLLLGIIVERKSGQELTAYVKENVLGPLGVPGITYSYRDLQEPGAHSILPADILPSFTARMASHGLAPDSLVLSSTADYACLNDFDILPAWAGIHSTASDAVLYANLFLNKGKGPGGSILKPRTVASMLTMQKSADNMPLGIGLAWMLGADRIGSYVEHAGGGPGINTLLRFYPKKDIAVAVMANFNDYNPVTFAEYAVKRILAGDRQ